MPFLKKRKISIVAKRIENAKRNGWRSAIFSTHKLPKTKYMGQWKNDEKEGRGLEISRHGFLYQGEWRAGQKTGFGVLKKNIKDDDSKNVYSGHWCKGKKQGFGIHWYPDSMYKGCFLESQRHGLGQMWWSDGKYYEGMWEKGLFHGQGILIFSNGNQYKGQFVYGNREGKGKYYHKNTGQIQYGVWKSNFCVSSVIQDSYFRQLAIRPTPYPICQLKESNFKLS